MEVPHFDAGSWTFVKGALATVDREFGFVGRHLFHGIIEYHVVHHLFPYVDTWSSISFNLTIWLVVCANDFLAVFPFTMLKRRRTLLSPCLVTSTTEMRGLFSASFGQTLRNASLSRLTRHLPARSNGLKVPR